ncbi:Type III restriction-modification system DNA endonuclease res [hydrothermal vent metagenome]|uniref:Type III restriction-modification system DNA endonuclease res n=1 Tax=hydrothermal vent metagenome TaxID=652676 RepID=A0A3B1EAD2_9ZZZZ
MNFLFDNIKSEFGRELRKDKDYPYVSNNLNPKLELREYQKQAFKRFYLYYENDEVEEYIKPQNNIHLAFNMATGSGKTVIMSGLILYLYNQGYRNFLFFVNRGQIVEKTKDNFINTNSNKYLFNDKIVINNKEVKIKAVDNFSYSSSDDINICFTTIQGLFSDIHNEKENSITIEDFKDKKIALIADEAHHINASTKKVKATNGFKFDGSDNIEKPSWENTVDKIFKANNDNILLEFTATLELDNKNVKSKYLDKIIYKYDLKDFVSDKYSKKIDLFKSDVSKNQRVLQALIVSIYREEIANKYGLNIKPVVLLKSSKIEESKNNQEEFYNQLEQLKASDLEAIKTTTNIEILKTIFKYFSDNKIGLNTIIEKIKIAFAENKILCTNSDKELETNQKLLNTLEDKNNPIRAIFTVDKLNEGWDVLNLFDIVRLYDGQSTGGANKGKVSKKTINEAQLVGRGARYCPFVSEEYQELFKRKYDDDITNELRILEELYFHSENESRYISEIKKALIEQGLIENEDNEPIELKLKLKSELQTNINFLNNKIFLNERKKKNYNYVKKLKDFGIAQSNFRYELRSGKGSLVDVFDKDIGDDEIDTKTKEKNLVDFIGFNIIYNAILQNDFYTFSSLKRYLPNLNSMSEFINEDNYLKQYNIDINGDENKINSLTAKEKLNIILSFLSVLEDEMKNNIVQYEGTKKFKSYRFDKIFKTKTLLIPREKEKSILVNNDEWFAFKDFYGTSEEENLIELIGIMFDKIEQKYKKDEIYLIRNERHFAIYSFDEGRRFEPDFVLFIKNNDNTHYQIFIEPKGEHIKKHDKWKEEFLSAIKNKFKIVEAQNDTYNLLGLKFYNQASENEFKNEFKMELGL